MVEWIDTHAHLSADRFAHDLDQVLARAAGQEVVQIVTVGANLASSRAAVNLAERFSHVYATVGVHPHDSASLDKRALGQLCDLASHPAVVAVGEIGLDYYRDLSPRSVQRQAFRAQLELASAVAKPVVVHIRDKKGDSAAYVEALDLLDEWAVSKSQVAINPGSGVRTAARGVLHCFSGALWAAARALEMGFLIGVDGPVTYPNAGELREVISQFSLDRLLLETDCPYLAPQAHRGRRNEPAYLPLIGRELGALYDRTVEEVASTTTWNARRLFGLPSCDDKGHVLG
jgi:TatD DNase family protein